MYQGLKYSQDIRDDSSRMRNGTGVGDQPMTGRSWLDRPMTGFGRMRAAISCGDLSRSSEHMSVYADNNEDEDDLSSYPALNSRRNNRTEPVRHDSDIVNEQTGSRIAVNVVTDSPVTGQQRLQGRGGVAAGIERDVSANSEPSYRSDWLSKYSNKPPNETARLESNFNGGGGYDTPKLSKDFTGGGGGDDDFDVDSLIVPCPPDFSSTLPITDIPFIPPPNLGDDDDLEGEMVPISLQEYSSGSDSVRSRKSVRSTERISTFFAPPPIAGTGSEDGDSGRGHSFDEGTTAIILPPPPPPADVYPVSTLHSTDSHSR